jgi:beta-glucosidase
MPMSARHIRTATIHALAAMLLTGAISVAQSAQPSSIPAYLDSSQPVSVGVGDLVLKMTPEEKTSQLVNQARAIPRLQVPASDGWSEALRGVANAATAAVFPEPIGLAATLMLL